MPASKNANLTLKPGKKSAEPNYVLVIHGGAGTMIREGSTPEQRATGGEAMDAAVEAVSVMEDCPLFNSGHGAVFNVAGKNELETSLMVSKPPASHPAMPSSRRGSSLAPHPMLSGAAAEATGASLGVRQADPSYFWTEARWREHRRGLGLPEDPVEYPRPEIPDDTNSETTDVASLSDDKDKETWEPLDLMPTGTVGAVALDIRGCIAAVTSTGGRTNKLVGRVGDTPVMGCGFWAEEWERDGGLVKRTWDRLRGKSKYQGVGVSGTGDGDYYIRRAAASNIARRMQYLGESLGEASQNVIDDLFKEGGIGGVIALDRDGNVALPLNCSGMYRGVIRPDGVPLTAIFFDEQLTEL
ncbi:asparaginase [Suillus subaureus]|uniref:Asparaginase n=1 Tax=Suillus subaureus TaxID=48587 RepID=A0A9P7JB91_9AGAM|nr:asparaginase [Suillus subaureus]KAG1812425.1 asparaginase [Suillus subaureus]